MSERIYTPHGVVRARRARTIIGTLRLAKRLLQEVGWVQDNLTKYDFGKCIGFCASGAISRAAKDQYVREAAESQLARQIGGGIVSFNDDTSRTRQQVLRVFNRAIKAVTA